MFKTSLRNSLIALSLVTLGLCLVQGYFSLTRIGTVAEGGTAFYTDIMPNVSQVNAINTAFGDFRLAEAEHLLASEGAEEKLAEKQRVEAKEKIDTVSKRYGATIPADGLTERATFDKAVSGFRAYQALDEKFLALSRQNKPETDEQAKVMFRTEMKAIYDATGDVLDQLIVMHGKEAADVNAVNESAASNARLLLWLTSIGCVLASIFATFFANYRVSRPMSELTQAMQAAARGEMQTSVPGETREDELGGMARAFRDNALRVTSLAAQHQAEETQGAALRKTTMLALADEFERSVGGIVATVTSSAEGLKNAAQNLTSSASETSYQSTTVASAAEQASASVRSVADTAEQLGAAVAEISRQAVRSAGISEAAVQEALNTGKVVGELSNAASRIDEVVALISSIAGQTNLLALNATIEAARAGESGRGFAVVASEVKELANQTARATADISGQIGAIQNATRQAVAAIAGIKHTIEEISETATSIAGAVEEQNYATREIISAVAQASAGAGDVTANISGVAKAAEETGAAANMVLDSSSGLVTQASNLKAQVASFLGTVRAA